MTNKRYKGTVPSGVRVQSHTPKPQPRAGSGRLSPQMKGKLIKQGLRQLMS